MHSIKNISERNKIETQSRADAYIRRKRLKTLSSGQIYIKKNTQKTQKPPKTTGLVFLKPGFFPTLCERVLYLAAAGGTDYERWALGRSPLLSSAPLVLTLTATQSRYMQHSSEGKAVLRIRVVYPGSKFFHPRSA
jgi:hypothetical protein